MHICVHVGAHVCMCVCKNTSSSALKMYRAYYVYLIPQVLRKLCWNPNMPRSSNCHNCSTTRLFQRNLEDGEEIHQFVVEGKGRERRKEMEREKWEEGKNRGREREGWCSRQVKPLKHIIQFQNKITMHWLVWFSGWAPACRAGGHWFDSWSRAHARLQARSPVGGAQEATTHDDSLLFLPPPL